MLLETSVDETEMGHLGRAGVFTAGGTAGTATLRFRYAPDGIATCTLRVGNERILRQTGTGGADVPLLLLCRRDTAPGTEDRPPEQRTHWGGEDFPTIIDFEPHWEGIVWMNTYSVEASRVRTRRASTAAIGVWTKTFQEFLALKCFEVLRRLMVRQALVGRRATYDEFIGELGQAEIRSSAFLDAAYGLVQRWFEERNTG